MSVVSLSMTIDTKQFEDRLRLMAEQFPAAIASGVTSTAREGRRIFIQETIADVGVGSGRTSAVARIKSHVRRISPASPASLTATMVIPPPGGSYGVMPIIRRISKGNQNRPGGGTISTDLLSGGPSQNLTRSGFFLIEANKGRIVLTRTKSVAGLGRKGGSRRLTNAEVKKVFAETVSAAFKFHDAVPRIRWERAIDSTFALNISGALQQVMDGAAAPTPKTAEG